MSSHSTVSVGWMIAGSIPGRSKRPFSSPKCPDSSDTQQAAYSTGTKCSFPGGQEVRTLSWPIASIWYNSKNKRSYTTPPYATLPSNFQKPQNSVSTVTRHYRRITIQLLASRPALGSTHGALSPLVMLLGCAADRSPPSNAKVKHEWSHNSTPHMLSWHVQRHLFSLA